MIAIKGMDMPANCGECPLTYPVGFYRNLPFSVDKSKGCCILVCEIEDPNIRLPDCPLIEIKDGEEIMKIKAGPGIESTEDAVNHPAHYTAGKVECIDALESATEGLRGIYAVCTANAIKYLWRWRRKGGVEDLKKAKFYIEHMIKRLEDEA